MTFLLPNSQTPKLLRLGSGARTLRPHPSICSPQVYVRGDSHSQLLPLWASPASFFGLCHSHSWSPMSPLTSDGESASSYLPGPVVSDLFLGSVSTFSVLNTCLSFTHTPAPTPPQLLGTSSFIPRPCPHPSAPGPSSRPPGSCMDKGVLCGLTAAGGAAGRWLRIADETEPFVVPPQAQYFFLGAGCVPGRADDGCARRCRLPARQLSLPLIPAPLQRSPALPLLPGYCQALLGLGGVAVCPAIKDWGPRKMSPLCSLLL